MATHSTDYDRVLEPRESRIPDDQFECSQCGDVVHIECRTELELQLDACSEECLGRAIAELKANAARAHRDADQRKRSLDMVYSILDNIRGGAGVPDVFTQIGRAMGTAKWGVQ